MRVARLGGRGRPRTRVAHLAGDKADSSRTNRAALRARRIPHTIPERDDHRAYRARRGAPGGRPPAFDRGRTEAQPGGAADEPAQAVPRGGDPL